jgi:hypothetical protein
LEKIEQKKTTTDWESSPFKKGSKLDLSSESRRQLM